MSLAQSSSRKNCSTRLCPRKTWSRISFQTPIQPLLECQPSMAYHPNNVAPGSSRPPVEPESSPYAMINLLQDWSPSSQASFGEHNKGHGSASVENAHAAVAYHAYTRWSPASSRRLRHQRGSKLLVSTWGLPVFNFHSEVCWCSKRCQARSQWPLEWRWLGGILAHQHREPQPSYSSLAKPSLC